MKITLYPVYLVHGRNSSAPAAYITQTLVERASDTSFIVSQDLTIARNETINVEYAPNITVGSFTYTRYDLTNIQKSTLDRTDENEDFTYVFLSPEALCFHLFNANIVTAANNVVGGGSKKHNVKTSSFVKTSRTHTNSKGVKRVIYVKDGQNYVRIKNKNTGKMYYRKV